MQKIKRISVIFIIFFSVSGFAKDYEYGRSLLVSEENSLSNAHANLLTASKRDKNIYQGNHEISPELSFGYNQITGFILQTDVAYRYFFKDKLSLGFNAHLGLSDVSKSYGVGPTARWYFYESGKWAFSLTQSLMYNYDVYSSPGYRGGVNWGLNGQTELGIHYFFTPEVALTISLGAGYGIANKYNNDINADIISKIGLSFQF